MTEKLCVVCLKRCSNSVAAELYELDDSIHPSSTPQGILSRPDRPPVHPENLGLCPEHQKYFNEGLVAVIEIQTVRNQEEYSAMVWQAEGRTGNMLYLPKEIIQKLADFPSKNAVVFCEREPFERIKKASKDVWS
ncbi:hypothetical protein M1B72_08815 [Geomonas paludis]|uniref:Uncharacterized protein n=1 Tax=Geomonas paludis TaxID=2740185 RepID=A0A6V8MU21_9BACT|nr:hypothetical protein [Geomonas paludis]UPU37792.1 hypothetical protein M1B72_08815 [Geomonas paludis]GFO63666.1 hypothetical protein GMPD_15850 [Geomonas paludis]